MGWKTCKLSFAYAKCCAEGSGASVLVEDESRVWLWAYICKGARIGRNVFLGQDVFIGGNVQIGDK